MFGGSQPPVPPTTTAASSLFNFGLTNAQSGQAAAPAVQPSIFGTSTATPGFSFGLPAASSTTAAAPSLGPSWFGFGQTTNSAPATNAPGNTMTTGINSSTNVFGPSGFGQSAASSAAPAFGGLGMSAASNTGFPSFGPTAPSTSQSLGFAAPTTTPSFGFTTPVSTPSFGFGGLTTTPAASGIFGFSALQQPAVSTTTTAAPSIFNLGASSVQPSLGIGGSSFPSLGPAAPNSGAAPAFSFGLSTAVPAPTTSAAAAPVSLGSSWFGGGSTTAPTTAAPATGGVTPGLFNLTGTVGNTQSTAPAFGFTAPANIGSSLWSNLSTSAPGSSLGSIFGASTNAATISTSAATPSIFNFGPTAQQSTQNAPTLPSQPSLFTSSATAPSFNFGPSAPPSFTSATPSFGLPSLGLTAGTTSAQGTSLIPGTKEATIPASIFGSGILNPAATTTLSAPASTFGLAGSAAPASISAAPSGFSFGPNTSSSSVSVVAPVLSIPAPAPPATSSIFGGFGIPAISTNVTSAPSLAFPAPVASALQSSTVASAPIVPSSLTQTTAASFVPAVPSTGATTLVFTTLGSTTTASSQGTTALPTGAPTVTVTAPAVSAVETVAVSTVSSLSDEDKRFMDRLKKMTFDDFESYLEETKRAVDQLEESWIQGTLKLNAFLAMRKDNSKSMRTLRNKIQALWEFETKVERTLAAVSLSIGEIEETLTYLEKHATDPDEFFKKNSRRISPEDRYRANCYKTLDLLYREVRIALDEIDNSRKKLMKNMIKEDEVRDLLTTKQLLSGQFEATLLMENPHVLGTVASILMKEIKEIKSGQRQALSKLRFQRTQS